MPPACQDHADTAMLLAATPASDLETDSADQKSLGSYCHDTSKKLTKIENCPFWDLLFLCMDVVSSLAQAAQSCRELPYSFAIPLFDGGFTLKWRLHPLVRLLSIWSEFWDLANQLDTLIPKKVIFLVVTVGGGI